MTLQLHVTQQREQNLERKLTRARVPAPRVFPKEQNSLLQANIKTDHRSQITDHRGKKQGGSSGVYAEPKLKLTGFSKPV